jgi:glutamate transport system permease protein
MSAVHVSVRDALYEKPGPKVEKIIRIVTALSLVLLGLLIFAAVRQFAISGQLDAKYWSFFLRITTWKFIGEGMIGTATAALLGIAMALVIGFLMMFARISRFRFLNILGTILVEFTRGVPTLLFIYFFFLVVPQFGIKLLPLFKISIPVAISASGVVAEVLRSGVNAVPKGQREAAVSLGMKDSSVFFKVVFPQAIRYVIPALIAELVIVVKDTSFAYVVSYPDLMQNAKVLISNHDAMLSVYLVVAILYILINYMLNRLSDFIAQKTNVKAVSVGEV